MADCSARFSERAAGRVTFLTEAMPRMIAASSAHGHHRKEQSRDRTGRTQRGIRCSGSSWRSFGFVAPGFFLGQELQQIPAFGFVRGCIKLFPEMLDVLTADELSERLRHALRLFEGAIEENLATYRRLGRVIFHRRSSSIAWREATRPRSMIWINAPAGAVRSYASCATGKPHRWPRSTAISNLRLSTARARTRSSFPAAAFSAAG